MWDHGFVATAPLPPSLRGFTEGDGRTKNMRPQFSLLALIGLVTFTAIGVGAFSIRTRPIVAVLSLVTTLSVLSGLLAAIVRRGDSRTFWIGFAVFSLGYYWWTGGVNREFYTVPGLIAELYARPTALYQEYSRYDTVSEATPSKWRETLAMQDRVRYIGNCIATVYLGLMGGYMAMIISANRPPTTGESKASSAD